MQTILNRRLISRRAALSACLALLLNASAALAATITVNSTADPAGFNPSITIPQLGATVTLRDAVNAANNTAGNDEIVFVPALAGQTITLTQVGVSEGSGATLHMSALNIASTVTLRGLPGGVTIARDQNVSRLRLFFVAGNGNLTLERITLRDGLERSGGAIHNAGVLSVRSSTVRNCVANALTALPGFARGGGIYNAGALTVTGCSFLNNTAVISGGGIYNAAGSPFTVTTTTFDNCIGYTSGGAIATVDAGGLSAISACTFSSNRVLGSTGVDANDGFGGGAIKNSGVLAVSSSTFDSNQSDNAYNGGAISNTGSLNLSGNTFVRNVANSSPAYGGALQNHGQLIATNCTFTQNRAIDGTAIDNRNTIVLNHCTIVAQQIPTDGGAAVSLSGTSTITNSIICRNYSFSTGNNANQPLNVLGAFSGNNNLIDNETPGVGDLGDYGGFTQTMPLQLNSPAINAGIATAGVTADQRGVARPQGGAVDIGAFEYGATPPVFTSASGANFFIGTTNLFQITASGSPTPTFSVSGTLPAGVTFAPWGVLTGLPATGTEGTYPLTVTATNSFGQTIRQFVLNVIRTDLLVTTAVDEDDGSIDPALGTGTSLREAINRANTVGPAGQTIVFSPSLAGQTIYCTMVGLSDPNNWYGPSAFVASRDMTIQGLVGSRGITITRGVTGNLRGFWVGGPTLTLNDLTLANWRIANVLIPYGGAIYNDGHVRLNRCTLRDNFAAESGAAIIVPGGGQRSAILQNCTVVNNQGSPALASSTSGIFSLDHVTVTGNTGGGVNLYQFPYARNSIIAGNSAGGNPYDITGHGFSASASYNNLIGTGGSGALSNGVNGNIVGVPADQLLLGPLADNGGPTPTVALLPGSPALDRGSSTVTTDQRGTGRPQAGAPDIGAFEVVPTPSLVVTTTADENNGNSDPSFGTGTSLREALVSAQAPFSNTGFGLSGSGWTLNGASVSAGGSIGTLNDTLTIAPPTQGQANSAWLNQKVSVNSFTASFRYTQGAGSEGGDGFTLTFQNAGTSALGSSGGGLGYGGIGQSVAFAFNIYRYGPVPGFAVYTNGNVNGVYTLPGNGVSLINGQPVDITVAGNGTSVTLTMTQGANVFTTTFNNLDIASIVGSSTAYIGFTGATGGAVALQQISGFRLTAAPSAATVTFAPALAGQTILLNKPAGAADGWDTSSALSITSDITIQGLTASPGVTLGIDTATALRHFVVRSGASLTLNNLTLTGGKPQLASFSRGGAVSAFGDFTASNCTFTANMSPGEGGAVQNWGGAASFTLENCTFSGNSGSQGGAFSTNGTQATLRHLTITNNTAQGGPVVLWGTLATMVNTIVAGNSNDTVLIGGGGSLTAQSTNNLLGASSVTGLTNGSNGNQLGIPASQLLLGSLGDNGGPTPTIALQPGSPAIDAGVAIAGLTTDQRGIARPQGSAADVGAFELVPVAAAIPIVSPLGGTFQSSVEIGITTTSTGAIVRYTLDGATPSPTTGVIYTGPFTLTQSATLKAIAYGGGWLDSPVASVAYTIYPPLPYWRTLHGLAADGSQDLSNPSGDGIANLLKYAFNTAPNAGDLAFPNITVLPENGTAGLPFIARDAQGRLTIEFVRRKASTNPGIAYTVETGEDLANLQPLSLAGASVGPINAVWERVKVTDPALTPKRFGRVRVVVVAP